MGTPLMFAVGATELFVLGTAAFVVVVIVVLRLLGVGGSKGSC